MIYDQPQDLQSASRHYYPVPPLVTTRVKVLYRVMGRSSDSCECECVLN